VTLKLPLIIRARRPASTGWNGRSARPLDGHDSKLHE
jgi:hypothetical protein